MEKRNSVIAFSGYMGRKEFIWYNVIYFIISLIISGIIIFFVASMQNKEMSNLNNFGNSLLSTSSGLIYLALFVIYFLTMSISIFTLGTRRLRDISGEEKIFSNTATIVTFITFFIPNINILVFILLACIPGQISSPADVSDFVKNIYTKKNK